MIEVPLTKGKVALIDEQDRVIVSLRKWRAMKPKNATKWYAYDGSGKTMQSMHRLIMSAGEGQIVDHVNGDGLDNRRCNLRFATHSLNQANSARNSKSSSKYRGVCWQKNMKKWQASIKKDGKNFYLGVFDSEEEASIVYQLAAKKMFGEFAWSDR